MQGRATHSAIHRFVLFVEGPSDRDLLRIWARTESLMLARAVDESAVILGGRQPARAVQHIRRLGGPRAGAHGLCVLDRDNNLDSRSDSHEEPGLELFTWPRRHIESYLLNPAAIYRSVQARVGGPRLARVLEDHLPSPDDEDALGQLDAKRLLGPRGPLSAALGSSLSPARIARSMRSDELHPDVAGLLASIREGLGLI